jgi:hypothetical protein
MLLTVRGTATLMRIGRDTAKPRQGRPPVPRTGQKRLESVGHQDPLPPGHGTPAPQRSSPAFSLTASMIVLRG